MPFTMPREIDTSIAIAVFKEALTCIQFRQICEYPSKVYTGPSGNFRKRYYRIQVTMLERTSHKNLYIPFDLQCRDNFHLLKIGSGQNRTSPDRNIY